MSKKPVKPARAAQPLPAQLRAIDKLLHSRDYAGALGKIRPLLERFPEHGGLRGALVEALEPTQGPAVAGVAAFAWAESRPNSLPAQEALFRYALQLGLLMLAQRASRRIGELGGTCRGFPLPPETVHTLLTMPDGSQASVAELERFDIGKLHLEGLEMEAALRWLEGLELLPARNNRALALYHMERVDEALEVFLTNWRDDPDNLVALGWASRLRLYRGDETGALGLCTPLAAATARRVDDALGQLGALLPLGQDQAALEVFERARQADWFKQQGHSTSDAMLRHFGACAHARLGRLDEASALWREAVAIRPNFSLARANLDEPEADPETRALPMVFDSSLGLPVGYLARLRELKHDLAPLLEVPPANACLDALYLSGDRTLRPMLGFILKQRATQGDQDAAERLKRFARLPIGTRQDRLGFLSLLREQGFLARDEPAEYWDAGRRHQATMIHTEIHHEPSPTNLPDDLQELLEESVRLLHQGQPDKAGARLRKILERSPDHPVILGNLAAIRIQRGDAEEGRRLLRQAVDRNPDYLFARCNLANLLIDDGALEDAQALIGDLATRERLHIREAFLLYGAMARLHAAKGDLEMTDQVMAMLESLVEDEEDARRLASIQDSIARLRFVSDLEEDRIP